jgi:uncharacterized protein (TIGR02001 family)
MLNKSLLAAAIAVVLPGAALAADAEPKSPHSLTGNVGLFSDYSYRGLSQTNEKPALQGGLDYSHSSGFYIGLWASNVSWISDPVNIAGNQTAMAGSPSASLEIDTYIGFKNSFAGGDWNYDFGFLRYNYPGSYPPGYSVATVLGGFGAKKPDTNEVYAALGYKWITAKFSYSLGDTFGFDDANGSYYAELNGVFPLGDSGFTLGLHVGHQKFRGGLGGIANSVYAAAGVDNNLFSYTDWKVSLNKEWVGLNFGLAVKGTDAEETHPLFGNVWRNAYGRNLGKTTAIVSVQKTF